MYKLYTLYYRLNLYIKTAVRYTEVKNDRISLKSCILFEDWPCKPGSVRLAARQSSIFT